MANVDGSPDPRYYTIMEGRVVDNVDPLGLGRVRAVVEGLYPDDGSPWAWPVGYPGAGKSQRGQWDIPDVDAEVYLFFLGGDPDKPRYLCGHWGSRTDLGSEVPTAVKDAIAEDGLVAATQVKVWETARFSFVMDDRPGKERLYMLDKERGDTLDDGSACMIEIDAANGGVTISGTAAVLLRTAGLIDIQGLVVNIQGRKVLDIDKPI